MQGMLSGLDWVVIAVYFVAVFAVAGWATYRHRTGERTAMDYFLANRHCGWFVIGASLFASNIGSEHLVGLAGKGASDGVAVGQFEVQASLILLLLGWVFVPFYMRSAVFTMPEFLERRYGPAARWYLAVISIVGYVLTKIAVTIAAGGIVFTVLFGFDFWTGAIVVVIATGVYTIIGGLRAVLYTDMLQMFVLVGGAIAVTLIGLERVGGWSEMVTVVETSGRDTMLSVWRPISDKSFPWTGILFGAPILGVWYWCTDQYIVQRVLSAHDIDHARRGTLFASFLKLTPMFLFVVPGLLAYCLLQQGKLDAKSAAAIAENADNTLPAMVGNLLPAGLRGLVAAGFLAALMSSLSSVFNSCSTLVTVDIYKKLSPRATDRQMVRVGRVATVGLVLVGLAWIPFMSDVSGLLYDYLQKVQAFIAPPIAAVFLLGIVWPRLNGTGAIASLIVGFVLGMGRLVLEINKASLDPNGLAFAYTDIHFLHLPIALFAICVLVLVVVSYATAPASREQLEGLTYQTIDRDVAVDPHARPDPRKRALNIAVTIAILAAVGAIWMYFGPN